MGVTADVVVVNPTGLHARPATRFVEAARAFSSDVSIAKGDRKSNAKSLISVLKLGVSCGVTVQLAADGPDADEAVAQLSEFLRTLSEDE